MDAASSDSQALADQAVEVLFDSGTGNRPNVTVTVSLFNYGHHVRASLDSVYAQTLASIELIVVDDASTDASAQVVTTWLRGARGRFSRTRLLRHRANLGLARTRNAAIIHAGAPRVFILDADNILFPRCLERLDEALEHSGASFAYGQAEMFGERTGLTNALPWDPHAFRTNNTIDAMVLLPKSIWEQVGGYSTDMPVMGWEDFDMWFKIARQGGWGILVPEVLTRYRVHATSMLNAVTNPKADVLWAHLRSRYPEFFPAEAVDFFDYQRCTALSPTA